MLQFFRNFFKSTLGVGITLGLLVLIALAFAAGDIAGNGALSGLGGAKVATVGREAITPAQLTKQLTQAAELARQDNPRLTMKEFLAEGGLEDVLSSMIDRTAMVVFGKAQGVVAGKRLVDSELARLPQLQNPDGSFSQSAYRQLLAQRQLTDADVRADIGQGLVARQLLAPAELAIGMPASIAQRYAGLLTERREGTVAVLPAALFAPKDKPADADVARFYAAHLATYNRPERRVIRYALFDDSVAKQVAAPTEAEIAQRYGANKAQYAASESRHIVQLILPGEEAAKALAAELAKGQSLEAAARARGLATAPLGPLSHDALAQQTSGAIADAVFAAKKGALVGPVKGALGYALIRVDEVVTKPARTLDQAHGEIAAQLASEKRKAAIGALTARIDDNLGHGGALSDAAKDLGLTLSATAPLTADGQVYPGAAGAPLPTALSAKEQASIVKAAFAMEHEGQPQLAELEAGKRYVIYDVSQITAAAPAPLADIRQQVAADYALTKGSAAAQAAAMNVLKAVKGGKDLAATLGGLGVTLPPAQPVAMSRQQLGAFQGRVPPAIQLLFSMAEGTVKLLPAPGGQGWFVVQLKHIQLGTPAANDPAVAQVRQQLGQLVARESGEGLRLAIRAEAGTTRNEAAIRAVVGQLVGGN